MRHVLSALVQNQPGVLAHISGMLASRGFNIDSLAVGETENPGLSRMTFVVHGDDAELEQVRKQLDKIVTVVKVQDISSEDFVERDLMLIKVKASPAQRMEIVLLVEMFRARVVDVSATDLMLEISGQERKPGQGLRQGVGRGHEGHINRERHQGGAEDQHRVRQHVGDRFALPPDRYQTGFARSRARLRRGWQLLKRLQLDFCHRRRLSNESCARDNGTARS